MQPDHYNITRHDANVLKRLIAFVSEDVFDEKRCDGAMAKSEEFETMINDARFALEEIGAYDFDHEEDDGLPPYTFWWEGPFDLPMKEIEYPLAKEVESRSDLIFKRVHVNLAMPSTHFCDLQIAVDEAEGRICTLLHISMARTAFNLGPDWHNIGENLEMMITDIVNGIESHPTWVWYMNLPRDR